MLNVLLVAALYHYENNESAFFSFRQISQEDKNWETNIQELQKKVLWFLLLRVSDLPLVSHKVKTESNFSFYSCSCM